MKIQAPVRVLVSLAVLFSAAAGWSQVPENAYQELHWRMIGPFRGGRTRAAAGVSTQPNVFYVGQVNGGVWKSDDYGRTWNPIFDHEATQSIGAIAVAPSDPNIIYVSSGEGLHRPDLSVGNGIYKSVDAGKTWTHLGLRDGQQIPAVVVDPRDPNKVFAAVLGHPYGPSEERGIYRSTDGGQTWQKVLSKDENTGGSDLEIDPSNSDIIYASMWEVREGPWEDGNEFNGKGGGLFKSTDGGSTWNPLRSGLPEDLSQIYVAIAPSDAKRLYATVGAASGKLGVYRSDDAGQSWVQITTDPRPSGRIGGGDLPIPRVDPKNPDRVYVASTVTMRSDDGGKTWMSFRGAPGGDDYQNLWINPNNGNTILLVSDQGAIVTVNGGASWSSWYNQPTAQLYHAIATTNVFPYRVCAGQQESGSVCISSRGNDGVINFRDWHPVGVIEYGYAAPDPLDPDIIYGGGRSEVSRYHLSTGEVQNVTPLPLRNPVYRTNRTEPLMFSPTDSHILYFASNVLFKSTDGGNSWSIISKDLTRENPGAPSSVGALIPKGAEKKRGVIYALAPSYKSVNTLWAGTDDGLLWITHDGGTNWTDITPPELTAWSKVTQISASHFDEQTAYASVSRFRVNDQHPYIYRTRDGGMSWKLITAGMPEFGPVDTVRQDPVRQGLLFAGTENSVWVSFDDGDHWQSLQLNLPHTSMRDLWVHDDDLIVATHGRGFWILDDFASLRELPSAGSSVHLFNPAPAYRVRRSTNTDTPLPPDEPGAQNPPDGAVLDYYLPSGASSVTLEILDAQNNVIRRFANTDHADLTEEQLRDQLIPRYWVREARQLSIAPGMHRWIWDLHYPAPETNRHEYPIAAVPHDTPRYPLGPSVLPGTYRVRLTVDGKASTAPVTVKMDPRAKASSAGLQKKLEMEIQLASVMTQSTQALSQGGSLRAQIDKLNAANASAKTSVEPFEKKLEAVLGGDAPPMSQEVTLAQVNEQASTLYDQVWSADTEPTQTQTQASSVTERHAVDALKRWKEFQDVELPALNRLLREANVPEIHVDKNFRQKETQVDEE